MTDARDEQAAWRHPSTGARAGRGLVLAVVAAIIALAFVSDPPTRVRAERAFLEDLQARRARPLSSHS